VRTILQSAVLQSHVVRACVRPSVTFVDQDHIGGKSWKLIARTIRPTPSLFIAQRPSTYFQGNMGSLRRLEVSHLGKWCAGAQKRQYLWISETRKDRRKVTAYRNSSTLISLLFLKIVLCNPHPKLQSHQSLLGLSQERVKVQTSNFVRTVTGSIRTKVHLKCREN